MASFSAFEAFAKMQAESDRARDDILQHALNRITNLERNLSTLAVTLNTLISQVNIYATNNQGQKSDEVHEENLRSEESEAGILRDGERGEAEGS